MTVPVVRFSVAGREKYQPTTGESGRRYTVIYDGYCKVCDRTVKLLA
jgi:hypothetical protein